ncbi:hypothetical protein IWW51_002282 [Coemansia sp. RSA 2702]|nr:hypothetical protein IWW51_002282 [Coemansia sp. RSA 2702]
MSGVQRPLVIKQEAAKGIKLEGVVKRMDKFLSAEAGVQSAPSGLVQDLLKFQKALHN